MKIRTLENETVINEIKTELKDIALKLYPIGCLYLATNNTNPGDIFGGTWELFGQGKTLVGVDINDSDFSTVEKIGGSKTHTLTLAEIPTHNHSFTGASHTHSFSATSGTQSANHTHSVGAHAHGLNSHTHSFSATTGGGGSHTHTIRADMDVIYNTSGQSWSVHRDGSNNYTSSAETSKSKNLKISTQSNHTHSVSGTTGTASGSTANSTAFTSGGNSVNHTHSVSGTTSGATQGGTIGNAGSGTAHSILQPYITCFIWKRIA